MATILALSELRPSFQCGSSASKVKKCDTFECPNNTKWKPNPAAVVGRGPVGHGHDMNFAMNREECFKIRFVTRVIAGLQVRVPNGFKMFPACFLPSKMMISPAWILIQQSSCGPFASGSTKEQCCTKILAARRWVMDWDARC